MVRTAPNELSFNTYEAWRDIYGFRNGHQTFVKSNFYAGGSFAARGLGSIVSERDPTEHGKMRKYLSHAFSDRSLKEQEYLVADVVDEFIDQIGKEGAPTGKGINLVTWFNLTTFDIITSLAFGETFGGYRCIDAIVVNPLADLDQCSIREDSLLDLHCYQQSQPRGAGGCFQPLPLCAFTVHGRHACIRVRGYEETRRIYH